MTESTVDRSYIIGPGLKLYVTPNGWYCFDWDWEGKRQLDFLVSIIRLRSLVKYGNLVPASNPRMYKEDCYETADEALDDLCSYAMFLRSKRENP